MHKALLGGTLLVVLLGLASGRPTAAQNKPAKPAAKGEPVPASAKAALEAAGLNLTNGVLSLPDELELAKAIRDSARQKKDLMSADREVYAALRDIDTIKSQIGEMKLQHKNLSLQLANVTDVATNNRLVGALNVTRGEIEQLQEKSTSAADRLKEARKKGAELRDQYLVEVLEMRAKADAVTGKWAALAADPAVREVLSDVNKSAGGKLALQPAASFASNLRQLKALEEAVTSESIKLENEGNSLWVAVTINDRHKNRMLVDSGASTMSLPDKMARDMGIKLDADAVSVRVSLADGRTVPATMIRLDSVRVGKFTALDVECCVLGPEARDATPLLGMSFLGQFKFEVDANKAELKLVKVDSGEPPPKESPRDKAKPTKKKK
jgi:aspartyl protease family protein